MERTHVALDDILGVGALTLPEIDGTIGRGALEACNLVALGRSINPADRAAAANHIGQMALDAAIFPELRTIVVAAMSELAAETNSVVGEAARAAKRLLES